MLQVVINLVNKCFKIIKDCPVAWWPDDPSEADRGSPRAAARMAQKHGCLGLMAS